jgi:predicted  nucleic acid-binding Zn-ribbon protein
MRKAKAIAAVALAAALLAPACNRAQPAEERGETAEDRAVRERNDDVAELDKRTADIERKWSEMQAEVKEENRAPTAALRDEVREDVANVKDAVAGLKTTTAENWWERHERATERTLEDVEADVQRVAKGAVASAQAAKPEPVGTGGFEERRNAWVANAHARLDAMEDRLENVKVDGALETELQDTRARIDKLQDDLDRLRSVSADEWWDVSEARVREYIDRVDRSIGRLDNDKR